MSPEQPRKSGEHYEDAEIAMVYLVKKSDAARELLAHLLDRTPGAIDFVWRWVAHADFPREAEGQIKRQVEWCEERLGVENRGKIQVGDEED